MRQHVALWITGIAVAVVLAASFGLVDLQEQSYIDHTEQTTGVQP